MDSLLTMSRHLWLKNISIVVVTMELGRGQTLEGFVGQRCKPIEIWVTNVILSCLVATLIFQHVINIKILKYFTFFLKYHTKLWNFIFYTEGTLQFRVATKCSAATCG